MVAGRDALWYGASTYEYVWFVIRPASKARANQLVEPLSADALPKPQKELSYSVLFCEACHRQSNVSVIRRNGWSCMQIVV